MRRSTTSEKRRNREKARSRIATDEILLVQKQPSKLPFGLVKDLVNTYYETGVGLGNLEMVVDFVKQNPDVVEKMKLDRETRQSGLPVEHSDESEISLNESSDDDFVRSESGRGGRVPIVLGPSASRRRQPPPPPPPPPPAYVRAGRRPPPDPTSVPGVRILHTAPGPGEFESRAPATAGPSGRPVPIILEPGSGRRRSRSRSRSGPRRPSVYVTGRSRTHTRPGGTYVPEIRRRASGLRQQAQTLPTPSRISASELPPGSRRHHSASTGGVSFYEEVTGVEGRPPLRTSGFVTLSSPAPRKRIKIFFGFLKDGNFEVRETHPWKYKPHDDRWHDRHLIHRMRSEYQNMKYFRGLFSLKSMGFANFVRWEWVRTKNHEQGWLVTAKLGIFDFEDSRSISIFRNRIDIRGAKERKWLNRLDELVDSAGKDCFITVHLEELPNTAKILFWLLIAVLVSTAAGIVYAKRKDDDWSTGISLMSYAITVSGFAIAIIGIGDHVGLSKPGEGLSRGEDWRFDIPTQTLSTGTKLEQLKDEQDERKAAKKEKEQEEKLREREARNWDEKGKIPN